MQESTTAVHGSTNVARRRRIAVAGGVAAVVVLALASLAGVAASERGAAGPDVIVGDLYQTEHWGEMGGVTGYSVGTISCNQGDEVLPWDGDSSDHPVIAQNMYRLDDDRFEQIGMSWIKHGFNALTGSFCATCNNPFNNQVLGVGCSDPYSARTNGLQVLNGLVGGLGPRSDVNAATGEYPFPYDEIAQSGDAIYKRLQVKNADLDPALNPGARYFVEGHYVTAADARAGNDDNNASYREVTVGAAPFELTFAGDTQAEKPAVLAWRDADPEVVVSHVDVPGDGRFTLAAKAVDLGGGQWRYEYALYNMNSHRSAGAFTVPVAPGVAVGSPGFADVDYHSGEPYDGSDWTPALDPSGGAVGWSTGLFAENENANALRWGTLYNFWFEADLGPGAAAAEIGLFRPGSPASVFAATIAPASAIFADGFESGEVAAWSSSVP